MKEATDTLNGKRENIKPLLPCQAEISSRTMTTYALVRMIGLLPCAKLVLGHFVDDRSRGVLSPLAIGHVEHAQRVALRVRTEGATRGRVLAGLQSEDLDLQIPWP